MQEIGLNGVTMIFILCKESHKTNPFKKEQPMDISEVVITIRLCAYKENKFR